MLDFIIAALIFTVPLLVWAETRDARPIRYFLKPVASLLLIVLALLSIEEPIFANRFQGAIVLGLFFAFGGDCFMMFMDKPHPFRAGLGLFLITHILYCVAFLTPAHLNAPGPAILLCVAIISAAVFIYLKPCLGAMLPPVFLYVVVITTMVAAAAGSLFIPAISTTRAQLVFAGSSLFYLSDVLLAVDKFRRAFWWNRFGLIPYYAGQSLIALSLAH